MPLKRALLVWRVILGAAAMLNGLFGIQLGTAISTSALRPESQFTGVLSSGCVVVAGWVLLSGCDQYARYAVLPLSHANEPGVKALRESAMRRQRLALALYFVGFVAWSLFVWLLSAPIN